MRIGICTQPLRTNYGGILQNYALQTVLKRMGHEVWTIDIYNYTWGEWLFTTLKILVHKLLGHDINFVLTPPQKIKYEDILRQFVYKHISLTSPRIKWFNKNIIDKYQFDALLVGSDQTWRPAYNKRIEDLFLDFARKHNMIKVAYAASFGTDVWEYSHAQTVNCASLIKYFNAISVREKSGIDLCKKYLNADVSHVLDPTLLLTKEDYTNLCCSIAKRKKLFIMAYILDLNEEKLKVIKDVSKNKGIPYLIVEAESQLLEGDSVEKWLSYFRDASFVLTDSFHGTIFSILFQKEFLVFRNKSRGNSRFDSLLSVFNLNDRIYCDNRINIKKIDWTEVDKIMDIEKNKSLNFLVSALN